MWWVLLPRIICKKNFLFNANHQKWDIHEPIWESGDKKLLFNTQSSLFLARSKTHHFKSWKLERKKSVFWAATATEPELGDSGPGSQLGLGLLEVNTWQIKRPKEGEIQPDKHIYQFSKMGPQEGILMLNLGQENTSSASGSLHFFPPAHISFPMCLQSL